MIRWTFLIPLALSACAPDQVGQQVGQSLYDASVTTGHAVAVIGDRTGAALQHAGANLRNAVEPPPVLYQPPPLSPDGYQPPAPISVEPGPRLLIQPGLPRPHLRQRHQQVDRGRRHAHQPGQLQRRRKNGLDLHGPAALQVLHDAGGVLQPA